MADNTMNHEHECRATLPRDGGGGSGVRWSAVGGTVGRGSGRAKRFGATFRNDGATVENNDNRYGSTNEK